MHSGAMVKMRDASFIKRQLFKISMYLGNIGAERKLKYGFNDVFANFLISIGWLLSFRTLKKKLGLSKAETAISGADPIAPEILKFFMALGVPIFEGYGMTENCGYASGNNDKKMKLGTVGVPNHGMEIKLAEDGEILTSGGAVFKGYFKNEEATKETIDEDGWLHTGDLAEIDDDGFVKIIADKNSDIIIGAQCAGPHATDLISEMVLAIREEITAEELGNKNEYK